MCDPVVFTHLQCGIDPRTSGRMDCDVIDINSAPDESAKKRTLTSMCMEVTYLCRLLGLSLSPWPILLTCSGCASMTATSFPSSKSLGGLHVISLSWCVVLNIFPHLFNDHGFVQNL